MKNLRIAVVPTETNNGIDQNSTVEEILACEETILYPITDYFKAQNDEEIDLLHWSFLIDIEKNVDLTGTNIDGIHSNLKSTIDLQYMEETGLIAVTQYGQTIELCIEDILDISEFIKNKSIANRNDFK